MVTTYLQLLQRRYQDRLDGEAEEFIRFAVDGAARMNALIKDLLEYARVGTRGQPFAPVNCEAILSLILSYLEIVVEESGAIITHDPLPIVIGDLTQMTQLFQNLVENAIKFRGERQPEIHVGVQHCAAASQEKTDFWLFSVRDNGIGIDPQYAERIFEIFQRLHSRNDYPGTGIGLAVCQRIVERHGGRIWVESTPGLGSTFYFTLPDRDALTETDELALAASN